MLPATIVLAVLVHGDLWTIEDTRLEREKKRERESERESKKERGGGGELKVKYQLHA